MIHKIKIKRLSRDAIIPVKQHDGDAAYDLYCPKDVCICKGRNLIQTDIAIEMPSNLCAFVRSRSGYALKGMDGNDGNRHNADVTTGLVDSNFRNGIGVIIKSNEEFIIKRGTRIAQLQFSYVPSIKLEEVEELSDTNRGLGGFGSTNK